IGDLKQPTDQFAPFSVLMTHALIRSFFPPEQILTDYFRITGLSNISGIRWGGELLATHEGQFKSVFSDSSLKIFIHLHIVAGFTVLYNNLSDRSMTQSSFIPLRIRLGEKLQIDRRDSFSVAEDAKSLNGQKKAYRSDFFTYLKAVVDHIMNEAGSVELEESE